MNHTEALVLAEKLERRELLIGDPVKEAAAELRRLHENERALENVIDSALEAIKEKDSRITTLEAALRRAVEALEQIACYRPLTFAECLDAEAVMGIAENGVTAAKQALGERQ